MSFFSKIIDMKENLVEGGTHFRSGELAEKWRNEGDYFLVTKMKSGSESERCAAEMVLERKYPDFSKREAVIRNF